MGMWKRAQEQMRNKFRAEGARGAGQLLKALAESCAEGPQADLRRGLLAAAGFCSVVAAALESGEQELGFIDIDGEMIPVDLTLRTEEEA